MISISRESALVPEGICNLNQGLLGTAGSLAAYSEFEIYHDWMISGSIFCLFELIEFPLKKFYKYFNVVFLC